MSRATGGGSVTSLTGTRLSLLQSGFKPEQKQNFGGARYGWKMMGGNTLEDEP